MGSFRCRKTIHRSLHQFLSEFRGYPLPVWEGISLALDGAEDERVRLGRIVTAGTFQQFLKWKEGMFFLCRFQQLRIYHNVVETRNQDGMAPV